MSKPVQTVAATPEQRESLKCLAEDLGIGVDDFSCEKRVGHDIGSTLSQDEARQLRKLAFELDTYPANIVRAVMRSFLRKRRTS